MRAIISSLGSIFEKFKLIFKLTKKLQKIEKHVVKCSESNENKKYPTRDGQTFRCSFIE